MSTSGRRTGRARYLAGLGLAVLVLSLAAAVSAPTQAGAEGEPELSVRVATPVSPPGSGHFVPGATTASALLNPPRGSATAAEPGGSLTFFLYGPDDSGCGGTPAFTAGVDVGGFGFYTSSAAGVGTPGTYQWVAAYSGDATYGAVTTGCGASGSVIVYVAAATALASGGPGAVSLGQPITGSATLSGGSSPTGTITFSAFGPGDSSCAGGEAFTSTVGVGGNGEYHSEPFTPGSSGVYHWIASYGGDGNNNGSSTGCSQETDVTFAGKASPFIVHKGSPSVLIGGAITDIVGLRGGKMSPGGTMTFTLFGPTDPACAGEPVFSSTVDVAGGGEYASGAFTPGAPGAYRWRASYSGDDDNNPAATACDDPDGAARVRISDEPPTLTVRHVPATPTRPEPGGPFTFNVTVTNTSVESIRITELVDDRYGDVTSRDGCRTGTVLEPRVTYQCAFEGGFRGDAGATQSDTLTVRALDREGGPETPGSATSTAAVSITDVAPTVRVVAASNPNNLPEPGGAFGVTVTVINTSREPVTIRSITDDIGGNVGGRGTCATGVVLPIGRGFGADAEARDYVCDFTASFIGEARDRQVHNITATVVDNEGSATSATDVANIRITDSNPSIVVTQAVNQSSLAAPGGSFTFNVRVTNTSGEAVTIRSMTDSLYGNLNNRGTCDTGRTVAAGGAYTCSYTGTLSGRDGTSRVSTVTVTAEDNDDNRTRGEASSTISLHAGGDPGGARPVGNSPSPAVGNDDGSTALTGEEASTSAARLAAGLLAVGLVVVGVAWGVHTRSRSEFAEKY